MVQKKQLAVIFGANRGQGASVVHALGRTRRFCIRGVVPDAHALDARPTRDPGVDYVVVDLDDASAVATAVADAQVIFAVTTMHQGDSARETQQGCNIMKAAAGLPCLQHLVWSTLPAASALSNGTIPVPHMDGKAAVDEYLLACHARLAERTTFYWGGFYAENATYASYQSNHLASAGKRVWLQPVVSGTTLPYVGDHRVNTGLIISKVLEHTELTLPGREYLQMWLDLLREAKGQKLHAEYVQTDISVIGRLWPGMGTELAQMLKLSEAYGRKAWSKKDTSIVTVEDLGLRSGCEEGALVTTESALKTLASKFKDEHASF